jgi:hypothetical protein
MTIESLNKRLARLGDSASPMANLADSLDMAIARHKARQDEWQAAGNTGRMLPEPLEPPPAKNARRLDRETWRKIAEMHAREIFLTSGQFDELQAAYAMSDEDLWRTLTARDGGDLLTPKASAGASRWPTRRHARSRLTDSGSRAAA